MHLSCVIIHYYNYIHFGLCLQVLVHPSLTAHCHKLAELGWLFKKVRKYIDTKSLDPSYGLIVQVSWLLLSLGFVVVDDTVVVVVYGISDVTLS